MPIITIKMWKELEKTRKLIKNFSQRLVFIASPCFPAVFYAKLKSIAFSLAYTPLQAV